MGYLGISVGVFGKIMGVFLLGTFDGGTFVSNFGAVNLLHFLLNTKYMIFNSIMFLFFKL